MKFYFDFACSGKPLKVKLLSAAIKFLYKWFSKSLCKFLARSFPTRTFTYSFRSRHPILPIVPSPHTPYHFIPPCLSFAYSFLNCFVAPHFFIKSYLSQKPRLSATSMISLSQIRNFPFSFLQLISFCLIYLLCVDILLGGWPNSSF